VVVQKNSVVIHVENMNCQSGYRIGGKLVYQICNARSLVMCPSQATVKNGYIVPSAPNNGY
jgi:hypothetical protein